MARSSLPFKLRKIPNKSLISYLGTSIDFANYSVILPAMLFLSTRLLEQLIRLALLFVLVVALRVSGAYLHYCLDGSEPPVRLHLSNDLGHHPIGDGQLDVKHADVDVSLSTMALVKKSDKGFGSSALLAACVSLLFLLLQPKQFSTAFDLLSPLHTRLLHACPPLRGPPL